MSQEPVLQAPFAGLKESATLKINQLAKQLRAEGREVCHLGFGESPFPVPEKLVQALRDAAHEKTYLPGLGLPELRAGVARFFTQEFGYDAHPHQVIVGPGSKELIFNLLFLLEGPLLIPSPSWVSYGPQAHLLSKPQHLVPTDRAHGYRLQAEALDAVCQELGSGQKLLILNNPSNPTGSVHSAAELEALAAVCRQHQVLVISDEIYALVDYSASGFVGFSQYYPEGCIVTSGLSKAFSAGGWRLGVALLPDALKSVLPAWNALISETFSCVSSPIQYASVVAFEAFDEIRAYVSQCTAVHQAACTHLHQRFLEIGLNCPQPEGGFYLFPDFQPFAASLAERGIRTSQQLCQALLEQEQVALLPGEAFFFPAEGLAVRAAAVDYSGAELLQQEAPFSFPQMDLAVQRLSQFLSS